MEDPRKEKEKLYCIKSNIIKDLEKQTLTFHEDAKNVKSDLVRLQDIINILNKYL